MTIETELFALLGSLVDGRCHPDTTPDTPVFPCIVYQSVGGQAYDYVERKPPDSENYRIQIICWTKRRAETTALALLVRQKIIEAGHAFKSAKTLGQAVSQYEEPLKLYGSRQDFSIWLKVR
ncbi:DUF3168 domain-containing protein [Lampropedia aestuarii]|uniref:DUF3168 domain-containing protein n=1 Tax=Lampropedia aestuarii TaxID=2562762 RepID=A0A4V3YWE6_9BURK|nr:DUF3168 domain-containing protein [Lampropedia aestuarii]THJ30942.1 DUF3168 domain-containing protein [Lampropedia aestuarii]